MTNPKQFTTLVARAALAGFELHSAASGPEGRIYALACGHFLFEANDLREIESVLDSIESRRVIMEGSHV